MAFCLISLSLLCVLATKKMAESKSFTAPTHVCGEFLSPGVGAKLDQHKFMATKQPPKRSPRARGMNYGGGGGAASSIVRGKWMPRWKAPSAFDEPRGPSRTPGRLQ